MLGPRRISGAGLAHFRRGCVTKAALLACVSARLLTAPHFVAALLLRCRAGSDGGGPVRTQAGLQPPPGGCGSTLPLFADACGRPVVFLMDKVRGEQTNAVTGEFSPHEAIAHMLAGTSLVAYQDDTTGGFTVTRRPAPVSSGEVEVRSTAQPQPPPNAMTPSKSRGVLHALLALVAPIFTYGQDSNAEATKKPDDEMVVSRLSRLPPPRTGATMPPTRSRAPGSTRRFGTCRYRSRSSPATSSATRVR